MQEVEKYILKEVKKVYASQGIDISDKHIEVMIRQMLRKVVVTEGNDTALNAGVQISLPEITKVNRNALLSGKRPATFLPVLLGISKAYYRNRFILMSRFIPGNYKGINLAAIKGKKDYLLGLKENVIIGKLIPAGTGCNADRETSHIIEELAKELRAKRLEKSKNDDTSDIMNYVSPISMENAMNNNEILEEAIESEELNIISDED